MIAITVRLEGELEEVFLRLKGYLKLKNTDVVRQALLEHDRQLSSDINEYHAKELVEVSTS